MVPERSAGMIAPRYPIHCRDAFGWRGVEPTTHTMSCSRSPRRAPSATARTAFAGLAAVVLASSGFAQGALTPPAAPAPTMKSLDQISAQLTAADAKNEARIAIDTLPGDATTKHIITQAGSYYLRGNIAGTAANQVAIRINTANVTVDLNGYAITGLGSGVSLTSAISSSAANCTVRNGTIVGWNNGVALTINSVASDLIVTDVASTGVSLTGAAGIARNISVANAGNVGIFATLVESCTVSNVTGGTGHKYGIDATVVRDCVVTTVTATATNTDATGIRGRIVRGSRASTITADRNAWGISVNDDDTGTIADCFATGVTGGSTTYGFFGGIVSGSTAQTISSGATAYGIVGSSIEHCMVSGVSHETGATGSVVGISGTVVRGCRVSGIQSPEQTCYGINATRVESCTVSTVATTTTSGTGFGINLTAQGTAEGNSVTSIRNAGIRVSGSSIVLHNTVSSVGTATGVTDGTHILVAGNDNRIEGNALTGGSGNDYGIRMTATRNLIIGNRASSTFSGAATGAGGIDTPEFNIGAGNRFGPIATSAATGEITTTNPFANYSD